MASQVHDARQHTFYSQDEVLFDANIWMYLQGPLGAREEWVTIYTGVLEQIIIKKAVLVTSPLVLSEFINAYLGVQYQEWASRREASKKDYRRSAAYRPALAEVNQACQSILGLCQRAERRPASLEDLRGDLTTFSEGSYDFNDLLLARLCRKEDLILVTHDADFAEMDGLTIVTANKKVLPR